MFWLISQMWTLLLVSFVIGAFVGWRLKKAPPAKTLPLAAEPPMGTLESDSV